MVSPKSVIDHEEKTGDFAGMKKRGRCESAGINRHRAGGESPPHKKEEMLHYGPESCAGGREIAREALTGEA